MRTGHWLIITVFLCLLGATAWYVVQVWTETSGVSIYGCVAMVLGAIVALVLGFGLMALMFYSNRKGCDESAQKDQTRQHASPELDHLLDRLAGLCCFFAISLSVLLLYRCFPSTMAAMVNFKRPLNLTGLRRPTEADVQRMRETCRPLERC
jgi:hypothetical protein